MRPTSLPRASAPTRSGGRGPCRPWRWPCAGCGARFPFELIHAHNAVPAGDAARRASPHTPLVVSVHGGDVLYTAWRGAQGARAVARGPRRRAAGARQQPGHRRARPRTRRARDARRAPRRRPPARAGSSRAARAGRELRDADARHRRPPRRPQAPRRRAARAGGARGRHPHAALLDRRRRPRAGALEELARRLGVADRVDFHGQLEPERGDRAGAALARSS